MQIRAFRPEDEPAVVSLWKRSGLTRPWNDPHRDIVRKLRVNGDLFLVGLIDDIVVATVMAGYDGHRGSINYLAVAPEHLRMGLGRRILNDAEGRLRALGCAKINLQVRREHAPAIAFYEALGYSEDDVVSFGKRLERDDVDG